jgi:hypothetical protein
MSKEVVTILVNGAIALVVVVFVGIGRMSGETAGVVLAALAIPSAVPSLFTKLRDALAAQKPPKGPSVLMLLVVMGFGAVPTSCMPAKSPTDPRPGYCFDETKFTAELANCAATASSRSNSRSCRAEKHSACGLKVPQ